ncbi:bifunctional 2-polyprenyl-6-hydroxyphenol methylase/3-demethylubiquinol 3-O-methyltransferase UbiG [Sphingomonas sp.]|uniref:bifunctional 2-polyprenyl-6-hydroxyphenol methylase/3-demethylubiquinol 3-O-methyltransferase UbiG n=1 Tax=Sphingomonas sp. TaxID=28214 RepID=UPI000DB7DE87|nr:bifunctional 2-polyprenyl-6-hydroxyphenol methylase/3-demethylubiquinol 3-O-methyltransferase UbiG [Sphingomonas sp.]PZU08624.1 MAG: bifunctional 2-polyprenyl-6-hydroxyphenol methylase/3-demethylubiquinol 3-O-methyltransferase UbiG [Sphingomonas sp.]
MNATDTINPSEAAFFGTLAAEWWDPKGSSAMLHKLNPVRLRYLRDRIDAEWACDPRARRPLEGRRALDVGCGAGLLSEPLARLGARVTGLDAAAENVAVARAHAEGQGLAIDYRHGGVESLSGETFDLIVSMEVVEHVADPAGFVAAIAGALAPGGLVLLSTPNRTPLSKLALITLGEGLGMVPKGTHDWSKFLTPDELSALLEAAGLEVFDRTGMRLDPAHGFTLSADLSLDYFVAARHAVDNE